ncbi:MAG TPA: ester cyclase [Chloroflexota bacterium]|nr:ester cyclase [Chloroflexota bacterium]
MNADIAGAHATAETARNKAIVERFCAAMNTNNEQVIASTIDELVEPEAKIRTPVPLNVTGAEALKLVFTTLHSAYPDLRIIVEDLIAEGDKVVSRNTVRGTHRGDYLGIAPTGKLVTYSEIFIFRFVNGRIAETWGVVDVLSQLRQLGASPTLSGVS